MRPGLQIAQACHTLRQFVEEHPQTDQVWFKGSQFLVVLSVPNEQSLYDLKKLADNQGILTSAWKEPDLNNELTGIALAPGSASSKLCSQLPLALKEREYENF